MNEFDVAILKKSAIIIYIENISFKYNQIFDTAKYQNVARKPSEF